MNTTEQIREELASLLNQLHQQRDEIRVKIHLAGMEVRDEWEELERQWELFLEKAKQVSETSGAALHESNEAAVKLAHKIKTAYAKIKGAF